MVFKLCANDIAKSGAPSPVAMRIERIANEI